VANQQSGALKLVIVHYHLRPGGIRRVIELATPYLTQQFRGKIRKVIIATGEAGDAEWNANLRTLLGGVPVEIRCDAALGYLSEQKLPVATVRRRVRAAIGKLLAKENATSCLVWAHNLGIARNLVLTRELVRVCAARQVPLVAHHHDWWFDNRWIRWPEMRRSGFRTLEEIAQTVFPAMTGLHHVAINQCDARILERHFPGHAGGLPNLTERAAPPARARQRAAREWLGRKIGAPDAPVWLLPCRLLRRKNVAEALLLARWLRPEAWLVTTGGVSSADETGYHARLDEAGRRHGWRLRLGLLRNAAPSAPTVAELLSASEAVMLTSIQEGFGLPYLEAAAAGRPLIARRLPNIAPDLEQFGFRLAQCYEEVLVPPGLFDWAGECRRQGEFFEAWKAGLPLEGRRHAGEPYLLRAGAEGQAVPFSRLTLTAQLEVLAQPVERSWDQCAPLNPFLAVWKKRAAEGRLKTTAWPPRAARWLSGPAYARRFAEIVRRKAPATMVPAAGQATQAQFIRERLDTRNLFPLLWSRES
jgi:glycosyltransferase involved in cell wall biosynthesis